MPKQKGRKTKKKSRFTFSLIQKPAASIYKNPERMKICLTFWSAIHLKPSRIIIFPFALSVRYVRLIVRNTSEKSLRIFRERLLVKSTAAAIVPTFRCCLLAKIEVTKTS